MPGSRRTQLHRVPALKVKAQTSTSPCGVAWPSQRRELKGHWSRVSRALFMASSNPSSNHSQMRSESVHDSTCYIATRPSACNAVVAEVVRPHRITSATRDKRYAAHEHVVARLHHGSSHRSNQSRPAPTRVIGLKIRAIPARRARRRCLTASAVDDRRELFRLALERSPACAHPWG
jgi:hypothetical protein